MTATAVELEMQKQTDDMKRAALAMIEMALRDPRFKEDFLEWARLRGSTDFPGILQVQMKVNGLGVEDVRLKSEKE